MTASSRTSAIHQPFPFQMLDASAEPEPKLWVVEGLVGQGEVVGLVGLPFVGKSLTAGTMALAVASSRDFLGQAVLTPGAVVYLAGERGVVTRRRLTALARAWGLAEPPVAVITRVPNLMLPDEVARFLTTVRAVEAQAGRKVVLVIIDTFARIMVGGDENSTRDGGIVAEALGRIASDGQTAVLLLHHPSKSGEGWRGSSAIVGAVDAILTVEAKGDLRRLRLEDANDAPEGLELWFGIEETEAGVPLLVPADGPGGPGRAQRASGDPTTTRAAWIVRHVEERGGEVSRPDLLDAARAASVISLKSASGAEQLRKALRHAQGGQLIAFDENLVRSCSAGGGKVANGPTQPPPLRGDGLRLGLAEPNPKPNGKPNLSGIGPVGHAERPNLGLGINGTARGAHR